MRGMPGPWREPATDPLEAIGLTDLAQIGAGGSSVVYQARQVAFDRLVAVKVLTNPVADDKARRRFERELALAGRLSGHPNVVTVFASGFLPDGRGYVVMEHAAGGSLASRLAASGVLPVRDVVAIGIKIAGVLELAARDGVVHRDVKPANILVTRYGEPALADFGIAVVAGEVSGTTQALTPVHAAPEVLEGGTVGPPADQWSLASTLHTLLAGRPPFAGPEGDGLLAGMLRVLNDPVPVIPRTDVPAGLVAALERAMAKSPSQRWPSAAEFGRALQAVEVEAGWGPTLLPVVEVSGPVVDRGAVSAGDVSGGGGGSGERGSGGGGSGAAGTTLGGSIWPLREGDGNTQHFRRGEGPAVPGPGSRPLAASVSAAASVPASPPVSEPVLPPGSPPAPSSGPGSEPSPGRREPSPSPAGAGAGAGAGDDANIEGETTRYFRHRAPEPDAPPAEIPEPASARRLWIGGGIAGAALVVVALVVVLATTGSNSPSRPTISTTPVLHPSVPDPSTLAPRSVKVIAEQPTSATLAWIDPAGGPYEYVVQVSGQNPQVATGSTQTVIQGLDPTRGYCFAVGTVYTTGAPAYAAPVCIRGGTPSPTTTSPPTTLGAPSAPTTP